VCGQITKSSAGFKSPEDENREMGQGVQQVTTFHTVVISSHFVTCTVVTKPHDYRNTLRDLTQMTLGLVRDHVTESVWVASAAAQRVSADANVKTSITYVIADPS
jgi:hypothetical protein